MTHDWRAAERSPVCGTDLLSLLTIDFTTDPWTVLHEGGPHVFFHEGYGALCAYLAS